MFKDSFKYYKSKCPPPNLDTVLDFGTDDIKDVSKVQIHPSKNDCRLHGVIAPMHWEVYKIKNRPGLLFIKNPFTKCGQRYWIARCLRDFPKAPHAVNLNEKYFSREEIDDWWTNLQATKNNTKERTALKNGMRWATLGYHHDWDTKVYAEDRKHKFPCDLAKLSKYIAHVLGFPEEYSAEAAIVNFYPLGTTLAGHTDHSEKNLDAPLFSISFGQTAIFLLGGKTKEEQPSAMFLKSGDIVVMAKESRLCYHAVPKILKTNVTWINELVNCSKSQDSDQDNNMTAEKCGADNNEINDYDIKSKKRKMCNSDDFLDSTLWEQCALDSFWKPYAEYIDDCRININIRQVLHHGETVL